MNMYRIVVAGKIRCSNRRVHVPANIVRIGVPAKVAASARAPRNRDSGRDGWIITLFRLNGDLNLCFCNPWSVIFNFLRRFLFARVAGRSENKLVSASANSPHRWLRNRKESERSKSLKRRKMCKDVGISLLSYPMRGRTAQTLQTQPSAEQSVQRLTQRGNHDVPHLSAIEPR